MVSAFASSPWASALPDLIGEAFPHSRPDTRRALIMAAEVRTFEAGHAILRQGDDSSVALVLDGHVAVRRTTVDGRLLIMRIVTRGGLASMLPLATRPAGADAIALTTTPTALWRGVEVRSLATIDAGLAVDILDHVLEGLEEVVGRLDGLIYQDAPRRVARVLHEHRDLFFAERPVLTRAHLPSLVGTSREMTGRVLRLLESRRVVSRVGRNRLRLIDPVGLAAIAEPGQRQPSRTRSTGPVWSGSGAHEPPVRVIRRDPVARAIRLHGTRRIVPGRSSSASGVTAGPRG
jgi:CRP-like cAMP-binding protein